MSDDPGWAEVDRVMLSVLQYYSYYPRQCGLIHIEQVYEENVFTRRGNRAHERAHSVEDTAAADGTRVERGYRATLRDRAGGVAWKERN